MKPLVAVVVLLVSASAACGTAAVGQAVMQDATGFEAERVPTPAVSSLNLTCFKLCQSGQLTAACEGPSTPGAANRPDMGTAAAKPASLHATSQRAGTAKLQETPSSTNAAAGVGSSTVTPGTGQSSKQAGHGAGSSTSTPAVTRRLLATSNSTANSTNSSSAGTSEEAAAGASGTAQQGTAPSTSLAAATTLDPAAAVLHDRYLNMQVSLALSDFFEIIYCFGNLLYAIGDVAKQGLASLQAGNVIVNAESILLFKMNMASVTAWWGGMVQNILLLKADLIRPLPDEPHNT